MFIINSAIIVPWQKIIKQADGDPVLALKIAASFGYQLACQDLDKVAVPTTKETAP
jgi:hypothetical protein